MNKKGHKYIICTINHIKGFIVFGQILQTLGWLVIQKIEVTRDTLWCQKKTLSKLSDYFKSKNRQFFEIIGRSFDWK